MLDEKKEIKNLRRLAKKCADLPRVKEYVKESYTNLLHLLLEVGYDYQIIENKYLAFTSTERANFDYGIVDKTFILRLQNGNIREQLTTIMYLTQLFYNIVPFLLLEKNNFKDVMYANLNASALTIIQEKSLKYMGLTKKQLFKFYSKCFKKQDSNCEINEMNGLPISDVPIPVRYSGNPIRKNSQRIERKNKDLYKISVENLYPPLSSREIDYLVRTRNYHLGQPLPIKSGGLYYEISDQSYFSVICREFKEFTVSGPSTSIDILYHSLGVFFNWNVELFVLACVAYLCNMPDHSIIEILLPCRDFGLKFNLDKKRSSKDFIEELIRKYS